MRNACRINKTLIDKLMKIKGEVRGTVFEADLKNIMDLGGTTGLRKVEASLKRLGRPINYEKMNSGSLYPIWLRVLSLLVICETFKLSDNELEKMGYNIPNFSFMIKLFAKILISPEALLSNMKKFWDSHYTIGKPKLLIYDKSKKVILFEITEFDLHPVFCIILSGYIRRLVDYTLPGAKAKVKETKCTFKGDKSHIYKISWA